MIKEYYLYSTDDFAFALPVRLQSYRYITYRCKEVILATVEFTEYRSADKSIITIIISHRISGQNWHNLGIQPAYVTVRRVTHYIKRGIKRYYKLSHLSWGLLFDDLKRAMQQEQKDSRYLQLQIDRNHDQDR